MFLENLVGDLNIDFYEKTKNDELLPFKYESLGYSSLINFLGDIVYSENDSPCPDNCRRKCPSDSIENCPLMQNGIKKIIVERVNQTIKDLNKWGGIRYGRAVTRKIQAKKV